MGPFLVGGGGGISPWLMDAFFAQLDNELTGEDLESIEVDLIEEDSLDRVGRDGDLEGDREVDSFLVDEVDLVPRSDISVPSVSSRAMTSSSSFKKSFNTCNTEAAVCVSSAQQGCCIEALKYGRDGNAGPYGYLKLR